MGDKNGRGILIDKDGDWIYEGYFK